jgi:hypothetical protein
MKRFCNWVKFKLLHRPQIDIRNCFFCDIDGAAITLSPADDSKTMRIENCRFEVPIIIHSADAVQ